MQVQYCDLCGAVIKGNNYYSLYVKDPGVKSFPDEDEYWAAVAKMQKDIKEICPTCKHIFDRMFELRIQKLYELTEEINSIYELPSKKNPKERNRGKEKKK
jgi:hypothetical protein